MNTAVVVSLLVVIAFLITTLVLTSLLSFKALSQVLSNADSSNGRVMKLLSETQDRFMAVDFASFKAHQLALEAQEGYVEEQEELSSVVVEEQNAHKRWFGASEADTQIMSQEELDEIDRRERERENR